MKQSRVHRCSVANVCTHYSLSNNKIVLETRAGDFLIQRPLHHHFGKNINPYYTKDTSTLKEGNFSSLYQCVLCWLYPAPRPVPLKYRVVQASNTIFNNSLHKTEKIFPPLFSPSQYLHLKPWKKNGTDKLSSSLHLSSRWWCKAQQWASLHRKGGFMVAFFCLLWSIS